MVQYGYETAVRHHLTGVYPAESLGEAHAPTQITESKKEEMRLRKRMLI